MALVPPFADEKQACDNETMTLSKVNIGGE
jgi:hypothetical protein